MTGNWHMNGKTLLILWIHQVQQMAVIKKMLIPLQTTYSVAEY